MTNPSRISTATPVISATVTSHAGEVLQGAIRDGARTRRILLSLPAPTFWTTAEVSPTPGEPLSIVPGWKSIAKQAAIALLNAIQEPMPEVRVSLTTNVPTGKGCGSSTTDVLATMQSLLRYFGLRMTEERMARLVVAVEEATDGSVLSQPTIFRHREGLVHEYLDAAFPSMDVLVIDTEPTRTINTVSMVRARYSGIELKMFEHLIDRVAHAFRVHDPAELGSIATESARISQRFLPKPCLERLIHLTHEEGGYGVAVSHSGTVASLMLPLGLLAHRREKLAKSVEELRMSCLTTYSLGGTAAKGMAA